LGRPEQQTVKEISRRVATFRFKANQILTQVCLNETDILAHFEAMVRTNAIWNSWRGSLPNVYEIWWASHLHECVLEWWAYTGSQFAALQPLARKYLSLMASSALSESIWSISGYIWSPLRNKLDPEYVRASTVLSMNWKFARNEKNRDNPLLESFVDWVTDSVEKKTGIRDGEVYSVPNSVNNTKNLSSTSTPSSTKKTVNILDYMSEKKLETVQKQYNNDKSSTKTMNKHK